MLASLENNGFLNYTLAAEGQPWATLEPITSVFRFVGATYPGALRLSRFACLRREGEVMLAETPLGHAHMVLYDARLCELTALLCVPHSMDELAAVLPKFAPPMPEALVALLVNAGVVFPCDEAGQIPEEVNVPCAGGSFTTFFPIPAAAQAAMSVR